MTDKRGLLARPDGLQRAVIDPDRGSRKPYPDSICFDALCNSCRYLQGLRENLCYLCHEVRYVLGRTIDLEPSQR